MGHDCFNPCPQSLAGEPGVCLGLRKRSPRFNPRTPLLAGELPIGPNTFLANTFQSAPAMTLELPKLYFKFQSAPAIAGGRTGVLQVDVPAIRMFQSAPAIAGGRTPGALTLSARLQRFNPRPPLLAGEPNSNAGLAQSSGVFQSAPAIAGGRTAGKAVVLMCFFMFQSAPAIAGGRTTSVMVSVAMSFCFNPRPPLLAGEP